ncbi:recombinase family protein [Kutzneria buriramensis]|uniref:Recombinase n=1 Tax=Kutzneria buriramensis TaxID=1045776 RepID=A0A3E0HPV2_9PSEU|nr:recombinase family protein [Kutzneria buriramensis]REH48439.1 recombinase [Kutzneria buriramensis]
MGFGTIAERLNLDLEAHPPPEPPGDGRARGAWAKSSVADVLKNPKYTGCQVYNRRARRSRGGTGVYNPPEMWVWSTEPAHEPLIPKWMFDELTTRRTAKRGSRDGSGQNRHPNTKHVYELRGRVLCRCERRMLGHRHRGHSYYRCWPKDNNCGRLDKFGDHPGTVYIREDALLAAINTAYQECLFGHRRMQVLTGGLQQADVREQTERAERRSRLQKQAADLLRRQDNLLSQAENADPTDPFTRGLRERYNTLIADHQQVLDQITALDQSESESPSAPTADDLSVVELLPHLAMNLDRLPPDLRARLYELTKLRLHVAHEADNAMIELTLPGDGIGALVAVAEQAPLEAPPRQEDAGPANLQVNVGVNAAGAPGTNQTPSARTRTRCELLVSATLEITRRRRRPDGGAR